MFRWNRCHHRRVVGKTSSWRRAPATPIYTAASLVTGHIKNVTLQQVLCADETDSVSVTALVKCHRNGVPLQQIAPHSRRWYNVMSVVFRWNRYHHSRVVGKMSSRRSAAATPSNSAASLVTCQIKNDSVSLQRLRCADQTDYVSVTVVVKCYRNGEMLQQNPPQSRRWRSVILTMCRCNAISTDESLVTGHIENGTLQPVRCADETDFAEVTALVTCHLNGVSLQKTVPNSRRS
jgi:hypothetical protein